MKIIKPLALILSITLAAVGCKSNINNNVNLNESKAHTEVSKDLVPTGTIENNKTYIDDLKKFTTELDFDNLKKIVMSDNSSLIFIGSKDCPACREFEPILKDINENIDYKIYYLDSSTGDQDLVRFMDEQKIRFVPSLLICNSGKVKNIELHFDNDEKSLANKKEYLKKSIIKAAETISMKQ